MGGGSASGFSASAASAGCDGSPGAESKDKVVPRRSLYIYIHIISNRIYNNIGHMQIIYVEQTKGTPHSTQYNNDFRAES